MCGALQCEQVMGMGRAKAAEAPLATGRLLTYQDVLPQLKGRQAEVGRWHGFIRPSTKTCHCSSVCQRHSVPLCHCTDLRCCNVSMPIIAISPTGQATICAMVPSTPVISSKHMDTVRFLFPGLGITFLASWPRQWLYALPL